MNEFDLIETYFAPLATSNGSLGLKDDVASLAPPENRQIIVTTDMIVEGTHFLASDPMDSVAQKLIRVNVSDIIAKGGTPWNAVLSIAWPLSRSTQGFELLAAGLKKDLDAWGIMLVGGDTTRTTGPLCLNLTLLGHCAGNGPIRRSGARPGEDIWVSGNIGDGKLGLQANLQVLRKVGPSALSALVDKYQRPAVQPNIIADIIARFATSSTDVSDGLVGDVSNLANASNCHFSIDETSIPLSNEAQQCLAHGETSLEVLVTGGDDYQVLFTAEETARGSILERGEQHDIKLSRIGETLKGGGISFKGGLLNGEADQLSGWSHF